MEYKRQKREFQSLKARLKKLMLWPEKMLNKEKKKKKTRRKIFRE